MKNVFKIGVMLLSILSILAVMVSYVYAVATDPSGPQSITESNQQRLGTSSWPAITIQAEAGNITALVISSLSQTQTWQGYYGNITGTVTLDDASNFSMYTWELAEPQGEIYASNGTSVTWSNIRCVNYTNNHSQYNENLSSLETWLGLAADDVDGIDETFNESGVLNDGVTAHPTVYVGTYTINSGTCPATDTYQNDTISGVEFAEILLTDNTSIIFTAIIENDLVGSDADIKGFNNQTHDFQMLVGDNGHEGDDSITNYYFFVELE